MNVKVREGVGTEIYQQRTQNIIECLFLICFSFFCIREFIATVQHNNRDITQVCQAGEVISCHKSLSVT